VALWPSDMGIPLPKQGGMGWVSN
jgi:hypothetical protein